MVLRVNHSRIDCIRLLSRKENEEMKLYKSKDEYYGRHDWDVIVGASCIVIMFIVLAFVFVASWPK